MDKLSVWMTMNGLDLGIVGASLGMKYTEMDADVRYPRPVVSLTLPFVL